MFHHCRLRLNTRIGRPCLRAEFYSIRFSTDITGGPRGSCRRLIYYPGITVDTITWLMVGLIAGLLASAVVGGSRQGRLGDIGVGMVGASSGGWVFTRPGIGLPIGGLPGNVLIAFLGAVVLLVLFRLLRPGRLIA